MLVVLIGGILLQRTVVRDHPQHLLVRGFGEVDGSELLGVIFGSVEWMDKGRMSEGFASVPQIFCILRAHHALASRALLCTNGALQVFAKFPGAPAAKHLWPMDVGKLST